MLLRILGVDQTTTVEVEAEPHESFSAVANRAGEALHYHGNFTFLDSHGQPYPSSANLEDSEDFADRDEERPLQIAQVIGA